MITFANDQRHGLTRVVAHGGGDAAAGVDDRPGDGHRQADVAGTEAERPCSGIGGLLVATFFTLLRAADV
jgi:hypothetical protein